MKITKCRSPGFAVPSFRGGNSQNKSRVVPKEERLRNGAGSLEGCRHLHDARRSFPAFTCAQIGDAGHGAILIERDHKTDSLARISEGRSVGNTLVGFR